MTLACLLTFSVNVQQLHLLLAVLSSSSESELLTWSISNTLSHDAIYYAHYWGFFKRPISVCESFSFWRSTEFLEEFALLSTRRKRSKPTAHKREPVTRMSRMLPAKTLNVWHFFCCLIALIIVTGKNNSSGIWRGLVVVSDVFEHYRNFSCRFAFLCSVVSENLSLEGCEAVPAWWNAEIYHIWVQNAE